MRTHFVIFQLSLILSLCAIFFMLLLMTEPTERECACRKFSYSDDEESGVPEALPSRVDPTTAVKTTTATTTTEAETIVRSQPSQPKKDVSNEQRYTIPAGIIGEDRLRMELQLGNSSTYEKNSTILIDNTTNNTHPWLRPFEYTILPSNMCNPKQKILFVVNTAVTHYLRREAIRETFANQRWFDKFNVRTMFAVGNTEDVEDAYAIQREAMFYGDILQADFKDAYRNLTIKDVMWMRYTRDFCPELELVVLLCDDIVPNIFWIIDDFNKNRISTKRTFTCRMFEGVILRDKGSPWYVAPESYPEPKWPQYCSGTAYIMSADMLPELLEEIDAYEHYIPVEDAFVTGVIGRKINASYDYTLYHTKYSLFQFTTEHEILSFQAAFGVYRNVAQLRRLFKELLFIYGLPEEEPDHFEEPLKNAMA